jgi:hypothetical protein
MYYCTFTKKMGGRCFSRVCLQYFLTRSCGDARASATHASYPTQPNEPGTNEPACCVVSSVAARHDELIASSGAGGGDDIADTRYVLGS